MHRFSPQFGTIHVLSEEEHKELYPWLVHEFFEGELRSLLGLNSNISEYRGSYIPIIFKGSGSKKQSILFQTLNRHFLTLFRKHGEPWCNKCNIQVEISDLAKIATNINKKNSKVYVLGLSQSHLPEYLKSQKDLTNEDIKEIIGATRIIKYNSKIWWGLESETTLDYFKLCKWAELTSLRSALGFDILGLEKIDGDVKIIDSVALGTICKKCGHKLEKPVDESSVYNDRHYQGISYKQLNTFTAIDIQKYLPINDETKPLLTLINKLIKSGLGELIASKVDAALSYEASVVLDLLDLEELDLNNGIIIFDQISSGFTLNDIMVIQDSCLRLAKTGSAIIFTDPRTLDSLVPTKLNEEPLSFIDLDLCTSPLHRSIKIPTPGLCLITGGLMANKLDILACVQDGLVKLLGNREVCTLKSLLNKNLKVDLMPLAVATGLWKELSELISSSREGKLQGITQEQLKYAQGDIFCNICLGVGKILSSELVAQELLHDPQHLKVALSCSGCGGTGANILSNRYSWLGKSLSKIMHLSVLELHKLLGGESVVSEKLSLLISLGFSDYALWSCINLGDHKIQTIVKLIYFVSNKNTKFLILDTPMIGVSISEEQLLFDFIQRLVIKGRTVVASDNRSSLMKIAQVVIDLGAQER